MVMTPSEDVFRAILRASSGVKNPSYSSYGFVLDWDIENQSLNGTFKIPIQTEVDSNTGKYIVTAQDFVSDRNGVA